MMRRFFLIIGILFCSSAFAELTPSSNAYLKELKSKQGQKIQQEKLLFKSGLGSEPSGIFSSPEFERMFWYNARQGNKESAVSWADNPVAAGNLFENYWKKVFWSTIKVPNGLFEDEEDIVRFWSFVNTGHFDLAKNWVKRPEILKGYLNDCNKRRMEILKSNALSAAESEDMRDIANRFCRKSLPKADQLKEVDWPNESRKANSSLSTGDCVVFSSESGGSFSSTPYGSVKGYFKSNGTYVAPHYRTKANSQTYDNWSSKGNTNPFTGKKGYKR